MLLTKRATDPITRKAHPTATLIVFTARTRLTYPRGETARLTSKERRLVRRLRTRAGFFAQPLPGMNYRVLRGQTWNLVLPPVGPGTAVYLAQLAAFRLYEPAQPAPAEPPTPVSAAEPGSLHAEWTHAPAHHVFRDVSPETLPFLALFSTADRLVYHHSSFPLTRKVSRYVALRRDLP